MRGSIARQLVVFTAVAIATGCGRDPDGYALQARGGTYVDGTGRLGVALLATLRDADGAGPNLQWIGRLEGPEGPVGDGVSYAAPGAGSWIATWWPDEIAWEGAYALDVAPEGAAGASASFALAGGTGIAPPQPAVADGGAAISWSPVPGAVAYGCRVTGDAGVALTWVGSETSCALGALGPGAYVASVFAYSADVAALASSRARRPALPDRFDVSEARVVIDRPGAAAPVAALAVAGGGFADGTSTPGRRLAIWISLLGADGAAPAEPWTVQVVGPGLPPERPLTFTHPARFSRIVFWSEAVPAYPGSYGVVARSAAGTVARAFTIASLAELRAPTAVAAHAGAQGSADVEWTGVPDARSYLVSARRAATGALVTNQWVAATSASFPAGTFVAGEPYDVFVAATDADMVGGAPPAQFAITENGIQPARFVAR